MRDFEHYKDLSNAVENDLNIHLKVIEEKLKAIPGITVTEKEQLMEEELSTRCGLELCSQLSNHINRPAPERYTARLQECKETLHSEFKALGALLEDQLDRLVGTTTSAVPGDDLAEVKRTRVLWEAARDIGNIASEMCSENVSTINNYATGNATQFLVSTTGMPIRGENRGEGPISMQIAGHFSDGSVLEMLRDMPSKYFQENGNDGASSRDEAAFSKRYGPGFKVTETG